MRKPGSCGLGMSVLSVLLHQRLEYVSFTSAFDSRRSTQCQYADASSLRRMTSAFALGCNRNRIRRVDALCFASPTINTIHNVVQQSRRSSKSKSTPRAPTVLNSHDSRQVAILLPEQSMNIDHHDRDANWHEEAMHQLQNLSDQYSLPIFENQESIQQQEEEEYSHIVTAVPYPRTNSFALAIHHSTSHQTSSSSNRRNKPITKKKKPKKLKLDPFFIDLCPPSDTRLGYRLNKDTDSGGGELLLKALGLKKMLAEKNCNKSNQDDPLVVYDLTAGLARDSLVILSSFLSSSVNSNQESSKSVMPIIRLHMVERDPIVGTLVLDAMRRLNLLASAASSSSDQTYSLVSLEEQHVAKQLARCLTMEQGGGVSVLNRLRTSCTSTSSSSQDDSTQSTINNKASALPVLSSKVPYPPDVIYLDPMFPPRKKKSSAVKKDMAMLHSLLGTADDASPRITSNSNSNSNEEINDEEELDNAGRVTTRAKEEQALLRAAYDSAVRRVVVKRPIGAPPLGLADEHNDDDANNNYNNNKNDDADIINNDVDIVPKPSYEIRGSVNRFDVYMIS